MVCWSQVCCGSKSTMLVFTSFLVRIFWLFLFLLPHLVTYPALSIQELASHFLESSCHSMKKTLCYLFILTLWDWLEFCHYHFRTSIWLNKKIVKIYDLPNLLILLLILVFWFIQWTRVWSQRWVRNGWNGVHQFSFIAILHKEFDGGRWEYVADK